MVIFNDKRADKYKQLCKVLISAVIIFAPITIHASDHADPFDPPVIDKPAGNIGDTFYFKDGEYLAIILTFLSHKPSCEETTDFDNIYYRINFDWTTPVDSSNQAYLPHYGGYVDKTQAKNIAADEVLQLVNKSGKWDWSFIHNKFSKKGVISQVGVFDDPFGFISFYGNNVTAFVVKVPLINFTAERKKLIVWSDSQLGPEGHFHQIDLNGRAIRSMLPRNKQAMLNNLPPSLHVQSLEKNVDESDEKAATEYNLHPDVVILDLNKPTTFPNGRHLNDDIVKRMCDLGDCDLYEKTIYRAWPEPRNPGNDKPFNSHFPYLAAPHAKPIECSQ